MTGAPARGAREPGARRRAARRARGARPAGDASSTASRCFALLWARFNPTTGRRRPAPARGAAARSSASSTPSRDREQARAAALALRERIAGSSLDLTRDRHHVEVERDLEQVIYAHRTAQQTSMGWLMGAMMTRQPYTLSVHVHALDRRRERQKIKLGYRRLFAINRGAEQRGRVPDFDRYAQEHEYEQLLAEMAGHDRANVFEVSVYQAIRAPRARPRPRRARRGGRLLRRAARVGVGLQGQPRRVPPARAVGEHAAARPRRRPPHAQVRDPQRRRHRPAGRHRVRLADRDPVRVRRPRPHASSGWTPTTPSTPTTRC